jgi:hypothetical protein
MVTLLDSSLKGGSKDNPAVQSEGALCVLRLDTAGYKSAIRKRELVDEKTMEWKDSTIAGPKVDEYVGDRVVGGNDTSKKAFQLPAENTPEVAWGDIHKDWVSVLKFADKKLGEDWAPAIQAAIDSGAKTVYFPVGTYEVRAAVHLRGKVDRLFGLQSRIARSGGLSSEEPVLVFDDSDAKHVVTLDGLQLDGLHDASRATLVLKSTCPGHYDNAEACGKLFLEDVEGADFQFSSAQSVWCRQWNTEKHGVFSHGASIWCLGLNGGSEAGVLSTEASATTEIFGALIRPAGNMSEDRPYFANTNSRLSVIYGADAGEPAHTLQIADTQNGETKKIDSNTLRWTGNRGRMDLYRSETPAPTAGN